VLLSSYFGEAFGVNIEISHQALVGLSPEEQINYMQQQLEVVGLFPGQTDTKLLRGLLQVYKTQCQINYLPQHNSPTPITLFLAEEVDPQMEDDSSRSQGWGWNQFADGEVEIHTVPGNHHSMMRNPHIQVLAQHLRASLHQAQGG